MGLLSVIVAAICSFAFGAVYYMALQKPWVAASGVRTDDRGRPVNDGPTPYIVAFICILLVAGMMRHVFALSGIDSVAEGLVSGVGIGLFFITPWIFINVGYADRPWRLAVIDGGYATASGAIIGLVLALF